MKTNVAFFYGCRSVEHEVSIISAVQAMMAINKDKYDVTPVYVTKDGEMYTGEKLFTIEEYQNLPELLKECKKVFFVRENGKVLMKQEGEKVSSKRKFPLWKLMLPSLLFTEQTVKMVQFKVTWSF